MERQQAQAGGGIQRPAVSNDLSMAQLDELRTQVEDNDRAAFDERAEGHGWSPDQIEAVWNWLNHEVRPRGA